ncbi:MAG: hypothetical protein ACK5JF_02675 [Oscillospiraceae bacterium]
MEKRMAYIEIKVMGPGVVAASMAGTAEGILDGLCATLVEALRKTAKDRGLPVEKLFANAVEIQHEMIKSNIVAEMDTKA